MKSNLLLFIIGLVFVGSTGLQAEDSTGTARVMEVKSTSNQPASNQPKTDLKQMPEEATTDQAFINANIVSSAPPSPTRN